MQHRGMGVFNETALTVSELDMIVDYHHYQLSAKHYLLKTKQVNPAVVQQFFHELNQVKLSGLDADEKLALARVFVFHANADTTMSAASLVFWAEKLKSQLGSPYFFDLFIEQGKQAIKPEELVTLIQLIIELSTHPEIEVLFNTHLSNLPLLIELLKTEKNIALAAAFPEKNLDTVINEFKTESEFVKFPLPEAEVLQLKEDYLEIKIIADTLIHLNEAELTQAVLITSQAWQESHERKDKLKLIALIRETVYRKYKIYPYNTQILALLSLLNVPENKKGRIAQIKTGEGKSLIIAMLSAFLGLSGQTVDVITSSRELAIRDQQKFDALYQALALTSSHICYDEQKPAHFDAKIIYSTNFDAEFSLLRDRFFQSALRQLRGFGTVIVDEVDSLFIDAALNSARLAIAAAKKLNWVYEPIFNFVVARGENPPPDSELINQCRAMLQQYQNGKYLNHVSDMCDHTLQTWLDSAYAAAYELRLDEDYVINDVIVVTPRGRVTTKQIQIVDAGNTGRVSTSCRWNKGKHEFVEVKHGLQPQDESDTLAAISHPAFFNQYQHIFGITGTIGEAEEQNEVSGLYNTDPHYVYVPPHFANQREKMRAMCLQTKEAYFSAILDNLLLARERGKPSVALFATISEANAFSAFLSAKNKKHQLLTAVQQQDEQHMIDRAGAAGMITIATNIAGRGADIVLTPESKQAGGLNIILTFFPENLRVEEQAFGRAGRQGQRGKCQAILQCEDSEIKKLIPAPSDRIALCHDADFYQTLHRLRSAQVHAHSLNRVKESQIEMAHYHILKMFGERLVVFADALKAIPLQTLAENCARVTNRLANKHVYPAYHALSKTQQYASLLLTKQGQVDWVTDFLSPLKKIYLTTIQQKWAAFFSRLDDERERVESADFSVYSQYVALQYEAWMRAEMQSELDDPMLGFTRFAEEMLGVSLNEACHLKMR